MADHPDDERDETALALIEHLYAIGQFDIADTNAIAARLDRAGYTMKAGHVRAVPVALAGDDEGPTVLRVIHGDKAD